MRGEQGAPSLAADGLDATGRARRDLQVFRPSGSSRPESVLSRPWNQASLVCRDSQIQELPWRFGLTRRGFRRDSSNPWWSAG